MTLLPDEQVAQSETSEQIAERLLALTIGKVAPAIYRGLVKDVADALRNRDQHVVVAARAHAATERKPRIKEALLDEILDCDKCDLCEDHHPIRNDWNADDVSRDAGTSINAIEQPKEQQR